MDKLNEYYALKAALLTQLAQYDAVTLNAQPSPGAWSVLQVCNHLIGAEQRMAEQADKKMDKIATLAPMTLRTKFNYLIMHLLFYMPALKFKAPAIVADIARTDTLANVQVAWEAAHSDLAKGIAALNVLPPNESDKAIYTHPAVGRLNTAYMLAFMILHTERHIVQINKTLAKVQRF